MIAESPAPLRRVAIQVQLARTYSVTISRHSARLRGIGRLNLGHSVQWSRKARRRVDVRQEVSCHSANQRTVRGSEGRIVFGGRFRRLRHCGGWKPPFDFSQSRSESGPSTSDPAIFHRKRRVGPQNGLCKSLVLFCELRLMCRLNETSTHFDVGQ